MWICTGCFKKNMRGRMRHYCDECRDKREKYHRHKHGAKYRGIEWQFTFETWWKVWEESRRWKRRGIRKGQYVMARPYDTGPYSPANVMIVLASENISCQGEHWAAMASRKPWRFTKEQVKTMKERSERHLREKYPGLFGATSPAIPLEVKAI